MKNNKTCYMCDRPKTSVEHVPPKCLFPEQKDSKDGVDYRKNLITVPSCDEHNISKSADDQYLLYILPASITSNDVGLNQFLTKVKRSIALTPGLAKTLVSRSIKATVQTPNERLIQTIGVNVDMNRIQDSLEKVARAIYFFETGKKHLGDVSVVGDFTLNTDEPELNKRTQKIFQQAAIPFAMEDTKGTNPEVFKYKISSTDEVALIELVFYEATTAIAALKLV